MWAVIGGKYGSTINQADLECSFGRPQGCTSVLTRKLRSRRCGNPAKLVYS
jgi:hypothetical protein